MGMDDEGLKKNFGEMVLVNQPTVFEGYSCLCPIRSNRGVQNGKHSWKIFIEGNDLVYVGVARGDMPASAKNAAFFDNNGCWGCKLSNGDTFAAGEYYAKTESFYLQSAMSLPCEIKVTLDCDGGKLTLMTTENEDLDLCDELPRGERLHLAIATGSSECKITLLEHSEC